MGFFLTPLYNPPRFIAVESLFILSRSPAVWSRFLHKARIQARGVLILFMLLPGYAQAGCGSTFCALNTQWETQGAWNEPGTRLDLRLEYIDQDQPRHGSDKVSLGEIPGH